MKQGFQTILLFIFGFVGIIGVLIFAGVIPLGSDTASFGGNVSLWGSVSEKVMVPIINEINRENEKKFSVTYQYIERDNFEDELIASLARGQGPDAVIFPHSLLVKQNDKIYPIPYEAYTSRMFTDRFAEGGELFLSPRGVLALPLYVDPLIMYWNRDLFTNAGITVQPKIWSEFLSLPELLTKRDEKGNIFESAVAMGSYNNITNAKDIIPLLFLQTGEKIIERNSTLGGRDSFSVILGLARGAAESSLNFYTEFVNPAREAYSWNTSLPSSRKFFESGKLAVYFGFASEYGGIKRNNPNLNFDVALIPQRAESKTRMTYGDMWGVSVLKSSKKINTSISAMYEIVYNYSDEITEGIYLPSLVRASLSDLGTDPIMSIFKQSANISRSWLNPDPKATENIFSEMINSINSGKKMVPTAIEEAKIRFMEYVQ